MKILQFDALGGASGDMILGTLFALGVDPETIRQAIGSLAVEPISVHVEAASDRGIHGIRVRVHAHESTHGGHHPPAADAPAAPGAEEAEHPPHRNLDDIEKIIRASALPEPVKASSLAVFRRIGEAEAKIHGTTVDQIHFHEVGALDSIADIVGCCLGLHELQVDAVSLSPLPLGHGVIECAHGTYPNPAPATVELLAGMATSSVDEPFELVTPTGAALLSTWRSCAAPPTGSRIVRSGYSIGHRTLTTRPNVLRGTLFEAPEAEETAADQCLVLECNLDDSTPEWIGALTEKLLEHGALDVFTTPAQMKKQRPGSLLSVLCQEVDRERLLDLIFIESTTFGVRETPVRRTVLERRTETVQTPYGDVRVKIGRWKGRDVTRSPEMDDCIARARQHGVAAREVYEQAKKMERRAD